MKVKYISSYLFLVLLGTSMPVQAQDPASLYFMEVLPQTTHLNPAYQPRGNIFVSLPSVNLNFHSDLAISDILQQHNGKWYSPIEKQYEYDRLYNAIGKKSTMFNVSAEIDLLGFGFRVKNGYFSFGISEQVMLMSTLPSELFKIPEASLENATFDFSPMRLKTMLYRQILIGYSLAINDKLTIGANLKPIFGQVAFTTDIKQFSLKTGIDEWSFNVEGDVYSSAPITMTEKEKDDFPEIESNDLETDDYISKYVTTLNNPGFAVDLGATYRLNEWFTFSAALNNFGFISWKEDLNGLSFNGQYAFNGISFDTSVDDIDDVFDDLADSLQNVIDYKVQHKKFITNLPPVFYIGATYHLTKSISMGFLSRSTFWSRGYRQNFNLSLNLQPYSFVALNIGLNQQIKGNTYFGGGFSLYLGPLQFYLLTDYIPVRYSTITIDDNEIPFAPERQKEIIIRTGLNLVFGRNGYQNKPMLDKKKGKWWY